ncbi:MAG: beta-ketoacyl-[acyl-carrier-protein] synthase family protein [Comamonadaceae bacterium]|nr:MAG: beta-ketoacyl-[acyl-carrier-protein] synthase family protein [Comamonadaceae bacterium]
MKHRVVVTGVGVICPLGHSSGEFFDRLVAGECGLGTHPDPAILRQVGVVRGDLAPHFTPLQLLDLDRVSQLSLLAAKQAVEMAGLQGPLGESAGVFFGTGAGGIQSMEQAYASFFGQLGGEQKLLTVLAAMPHAPASQVALRYGVKGECQTYSSACSSSTVAIGEAFRRIRDGELRFALAGGGESMLTPGVLHSWSSLRVLCDEPPQAPGTGCRPFSADRSGFALGEGAAFVVLESLAEVRARGAYAIAEITGYGVSNDASHISRPNPLGQVLAMRRALAMGRTKPHEVGYINANGTGTQAGDLTETNAIKMVFGDHAHQLAVSSTKSGHGHLIGAAGAVEFVASLMALTRQVVPPTANWTSRDAGCDLDYVPRIGRPVEGLSHIMCNSFAFGGNNAVLVAKAIEP